MRQCCSWLAAAGGERKAPPRRRKAAPIVLTVPLGTMNFLECYADGVVVTLERLEEESQGVYTSAPLGSLAGDEQWTEEEHPLKNGDRYDITFGEAGFFRLSIRNSSGAVDAYYFMVAE